MHFFVDECTLYAVVLFVANSRKKLKRKNMKAFFRTTINYITSQNQSESHILPGKTQLEFYIIQLCVYGKAWFLLKEFYIKCLNEMHKVVDCGEQQSRPDIILGCIKVHGDFQLVREKKKKPIISSLQLQYSVKIKKIQCL